MSSAPFARKGSPPSRASRLRLFWEHDLPYPSHTSALSELERSALVADRGVEALWFRGVAPLGLSRTPAAEVERKIDPVAADLHAAGCENPDGAFLCELAHRLSRLVWREHGVEATPDFAYWAVEHDVPTGWVHETFRVTARPDVVSAYEGAGWLPRESFCLPGRDATGRGGERCRRAAELIEVMSELFDAAEIFGWLEDPMLGAEELGVPEREQTDLIAPIQAIRSGRSDAVLALAREQFGP